MATLITQKEYARRRKVTPQYISKLVREGKIVLKNGLVDPKQADAARGHATRKATKKSARKRPTARKRPAVGRPPRGSATHSLTDGRAQKVHWEALQAKLEYERTAGGLLPKSEVLEAERRKNSNIRTRIRSMARSLAPLLARSATPAECESLLLAEIDHQLSALAADPLGLDEPATTMKPTEEQPSSVSPVSSASSVVNAFDRPTPEGALQTSAIANEASV